jgi:hypothetical protein
MQDAIARYTQRQAALDQKRHARLERVEFEHHLFPRLLDVRAQADDILDKIRSAHPADTVMLHAIHVAARNGCLAAIPVLLRVACAFSLWKEHDALHDEYVLRIKHRYRNRLKAEYAHQWHARAVTKLTPWIREVLSAQMNRDHVPQELLKRMPTNLGPIEWDLLVEVRLCAAPVSPRRLVEALADEMGCVFLENFRSLRFREPPPDSPLLAHWRAFDRHDAVRKRVAANIGWCPSELADLVARYVVG